jgi:hypothetical protein
MGKYERADMQVRRYSPLTPTLSRRKRVERGLEESKQSLDQKCVPKLELGNESVK